MKQIKKYIFYVFIVVASVFFLFLIFNEPIKNNLMEKQTKDFVKQIETITPETMQENKEKPATYDYEQVQPISDTTVYTSQIGEVLKANKKDTAFNTVAFVSIPSVQINLPIFQGLDNENLLYGAGTVKPNQELGKGNYVLASHKTDQPSLLFTPLDKVQIGDNIFITDKSSIYLYKVNDIFLVEPNRVEILNDEKGKKMVTLFTCSDLQATNRVVVTGIFTTSWLFDKAPEQAKEAFNIATQTF